MELCAANLGMDKQGFVNFARVYYASHDALINEATEGQHNVRLWHLLRIGLPTASIAHRIVTRMRRITKQLPNLNDPTRLIRDIIVPSTFQSPAMQKGQQMEEYISQLYLKEMMKRNKTNCKLHKCGLKVHKDFGLIAGSVDRLFTCDSEDMRVVEIKCVKSIEKHGCIKNNELKENHQYFYQLQVNMGVHNLKNSHFVIFENDENFLIIEVDFKKDLFESIVNTCTSFFTDYLLHYIKHPEDLNELRK